MRKTVPFLAMLILTIGLLYSINEVNNLSDELEQQERKNEALQEENALLHDELWNLNDQLMKYSD